MEPELLRHKLIYTEGVPQTKYLTMHTVGAPELVKTLLEYINKLPSPHLRLWSIIVRGTESVQTGIMAQKEERSQSFHKGIVITIRLLNSLTGNFLSPQDQVMRHDNTPQGFGKKTLVCL